LTDGGGVTGWRGAGVDGTAAIGEGAGWLLLHPRIVPEEAKARSVRAGRSGVRRFRDTEGEACGVRAIMESKIMESKIMEWALPLRFF
jgi:hypothetical protein